MTDVYTYAQLDADRDRILPGMPLFLFLQMLFLFGIQLLYVAGIMHE